MKGLCSFMVSLHGFVDLDLGIEYKLLTDPHLYASL